MESTNRRPGVVQLGRTHDVLRACSRVPERSVETLCGSWKLAFTVAALLFVIIVLMACKAMSTPVVADASKLVLERAGRLESHLNGLHDRPSTHERYY